MISLFPASAETSDEKSFRSVKLKPVDRLQMRLETVEVDKLIDPEPSGTGDLGLCRSIGFEFIL